jgi:hypothetical protein
MQMKMTQRALKEAKLGGDIDHQLFEEISSLDMDIINDRGSIKKINASL